MAKAGEEAYIRRQESILRHMASMINIDDLPPISSVADFSSIGFRAIPSIYLKGDAGNGRKVMAHLEGGYWMAKMIENPDLDYNAVLDRLMLVVRAEEESGQARYLEVSDFMIVQLLRIYCLFRNKINVLNELWSRLEILFANYIYATYYEPMSENHKICHLSSEIIAANLFPKRIFHDGLNGREKVRMIKKDIFQFLEKRLKYGWGEFDSISYYNIDFISLLNIYDFQPDPELKKMVWDTLNFMLIDMLHHAIGGYVGGAKGRVYFNKIADSKEGVFWPLYICTGLPENIRFDNKFEVSEAFFSTSGFRPADAVVMLASMPISEGYEVKERNALYSIPDDIYVKGSIKRYSYVAPGYVLGSVAQRDRYEALSFHAWLAGHQEQSWSLVFGGNSKAVIYSSHPGHQDLDDWGMHNYWTGDTNCLCGRYLQHRNILVGLHSIEKQEQLPWIHFYIPRYEFDEILEQYGWLLQGAEKRLQPSNLFLDTTGPQTANGLGRKSLYRGKTLLLLLKSLMIIRRI